MEGLNLEKTKIKAPKIKELLTRRNAFLFIITLVLMFFLFQQVTAMKEKKNFEVSDEVLNKFYNQLLIELPESTSHETEKFCHYARPKFALRDVITCFTTFSIKYEGLTLQQANDVGLKFKTLLSSNKVEYLSYSERKPELTRNMFPFIRENGDHVMDLKFKNLGNKPACTASIIFYDPTEDNEIKGKLSINGVCSGEAKREHYPVKLYR